MVELIYYHQDSSIGVVMWGDGGALSVALYHKIDGSNILKAEIVTKKYFL
jgi:hypothetical protein